MPSCRTGHNPTAAPPFLSLSDWFQHIHKHAYKHAHAHTHKYTQNIYSLDQADLPMNPKRRLLTGHALYAL